MRKRLVGKKMKRTIQQQKVIDSKGCNLLVSAGAGSGKTSVMIERAVKFLVEGGSIEKLLMITFTNAAASEMRIKMENELSKFLMQTTDENVANLLKKQLSLISQADICTVHNFCQKIIKKYFYILGIDPSFSIIDDTQSMVYSSRAIKTVFDELLKNDDQQFLALLESYNEKRNFDKLASLVVETYLFLQQSPDVESFTNQILSVYETDVSKSKVANVVNDFVCSKIDYYAKCFAFIRQKANMIDHTKLVDAADKVLAKICVIKKENGFLKNQKLIFNIEDLPIKPRDGDDFCFNELNALFKQYKEDLSKDLKVMCERYFYTSSESTIVNDLQLAKQNVEALIKVTLLYSDEYAKIKRENNQLDFNDLEHFALKILGDRNVQNQVKNCYDQIYVDEYQDINNIQESIISMVATEGKLFLVGDVKQSIYRFRNTNPQIFVDKFNEYLLNGKTKCAEELNDNFRTDNAVLQFINYIFKRAMTVEVADVDYAKNGMLNGGLEFKTPENATAKSCICVVREEKKEKEEVLARGVYSVENAESCAKEESEFAKAEGYIIAQKINEIMLNQKVLYDPKKQAMRPIKYSDITLLTRNRGAYLDTLTSTLKGLGVPVNGVSGASIFLEYEIQILHNFLKLLYNSQDDFAFASFLTSPMVGFSMQELADLRLLNPKGKFWDICNKNAENNTKLKKAQNLLSEGRNEINSGTIYEVLNSLIRKTNLLFTISKMDNGKQRVLNIKTFVQHFLNHSYNESLVEYFEFVNNTENVNIPISNVGVENAVKICTMHESKGLEYPIVFVVATGHNFNKDSMKGAYLKSSVYGIGLEAFYKQSRTKHSTLVRSAILIEEEQQQLAEELRLLYVALTRAKNNLYIVGKANLDSIYHANGKFDLLRQGNFMNIILSVLDDTTLNSLKNGTSKVVLQKGKIDEFNVEVYCPISDENLDLKNKMSFENELDKKLLPTFKGQISNYLNYEYPHKKSTEILAKSSVTKIMKQNEEVLQNVEAPSQFYKSEIEIETNVDVGIAYHKAMELMDYSLKTEAEVERHLKNVLSLDEFSLINCGTLTKCVNHFAPLMQGAKVLREQKFYLNVPYNQIVKNSNVVDNIVIEGIIDLVIIKGNDAVLVDFKTTNITDANKLKQKYKIQLDCYQKAIENALNCTVSKKIIYSFLNEMEISFDK